MALFRRRYPGRPPVAFTFSHATNGAFSMTLRTDGARTLWVSWGDGTALEKCNVTASDIVVSHTYPSAASKVVIVYGPPRWITRLDLAAMVVLGLDVSGLMGLTYLRATGTGNTVTGSIAALTSLTYLNVTGSNTLSGSVAGLTSLTYLLVYGSNTLSGSVAGLTSLTYLDVTGSNTLSGSVAGLTSLTYLLAYGSNTLSGSVAGLTSLTVLYVLGGNTFSGSVAGLTSLTYLNVTGSNTLSGSVAGLTSLTYLRVLGSNTISGSIAALTSLTYLYVTGSNTISGSVAALTSLIYLRVEGGLNTISWIVGPLTLLQNLYAQNNALNQATVDGICSAMYAARAGYSYATPAAYLGGTNAAPSGTYAHEGPPPVGGKNMIYTLVNDENAEGFKKWAITYTA